MERKLKKFVKTPLNVPFLYRFVAKPSSVLVTATSKKGRRLFSSSSSVNNMKERKRERKRERRKEGKKERKEKKRKTMKERITVTRADLYRCGHGVTA